MILNISSDHLITFNGVPLLGDAFAIAYAQAQAQAFAAAEAYSLAISLIKSTCCFHDQYIIDAVFALTDVIAIAKSSAAALAQVNK